MILAEMRILRWVSGNVLNHRIGNDVIHSETSFNSGQGEMIWTLESLDMSNGTQWMWRVGRMILDEGSARSLGLAVE